MPRGPEPSFTLTKGAGRVVFRVVSPELVAVARYDGGKHTGTSVVLTARAKGMWTDLLARGFKRADSEEGKPGAVPG